MIIEKVTVRSQPNPRSGANPVGSGLIFLFDTMESFELTKPFWKMNKDEYNEWKSKRATDSRPLKPYEPVAFF
jgi:hypothetical protein